MSKRGQSSSAGGRGEWRDAIVIYQSHFSRKRVVLAFPLKSHGAEDSLEPRGGGKGKRAEKSEMEKDVPFSEVNERHGTWHYSSLQSPLHSPPRRAGVPRFYAAASARGPHSLARRRGGTSGAATVGHVFAHSALRRPSPPPRAVRCKHAAGVRQVAANARVRNNWTSRFFFFFDERVIVTVYDVFPVVAFVTRTSERIERARTKCIYYIPFYSTERWAPRTVISRASRRPGFADSIVSGSRRGRERRRERGQPGGVVGKGATTRIYRWVSILRFNRQRCSIGQAFEAGFTRKNLTLKINMKYFSW